MKLWQAIVTAEMASGSVWADRYTSFPAHIVAEGLAIGFGVLLWEAGARFWPTRKDTPA